MVNNFRTLLASFMKFEVIIDLSAKKLKKLNIEDNVRQPRTFFFGEKNEKLIKKIMKSKSDSVLVKDFLTEIEQVFIKSAVYIQKKYAMDNELLICLSALDPIVRGHSKAHSLLLKLIEFFKFAIPSESDNDITNQLMNFKIDQCLPNFEIGERIDKWWNFVFQSGRYPSLSKIVKAALSIFTGPQIEASFSVMNDMDKKSNRMDVSTYSAIMNVKYSLKAENTTFKKYYCKDILHHPLNPRLLYDMRTSRSRYTRKLAESQKRCGAKNHVYGKDLKGQKMKAASVHSVAENVASNILVKGKSTMEPGCITVASQHDPDLPTSSRNISNEERTDAVSVVPAKRPATDVPQNFSKSRKLKQISLSKFFKTS